MAPSRKKGAGKASAAAAAAACRQWKVGDLVLAKVKGFPAWPATVSEPEKWGYSADWKKVLVYFFGTKQIAFCNPADVEAFTEEKKKTLLIKRQGKGGDFVRAVQEIIDSYEKSKMQNRVDSVSSGDEVSVTNDGNPVDFEANNALKAQTETPTATLNLRLKTLGSAKDRTETSLVAEDAGAAKQFDALEGREALSDELTDNVLDPETSQVPTYSSRKRSRGTQPQNCVTLKVASSVRRSRSSSRAENGRLHSFTMPSCDVNKNSVDVPVNSLQDESLGRNMDSSKSPDAFVCHDVDAVALVANGSIDNGSEVANADSDTRSFNEVSTIESGCKNDCSDPVVECLEEDAGLSREFDLQTEPVVTRKKRQPTRKRLKNEAAACSRFGGEPGLEAQDQKIGKHSPIVCEKSSEKIAREDGDKHLPLVKRARVRMGKSSSMEEKLSTSVQAGEKSTTETETSVGQVGTSLTFSDTILANRDAVLVKSTENGSSPSVNCNPATGHLPALRDVKRSHPYGFLVDGEAALPPSKRLHRALEAMSANAAEDGQVHCEVLTKKQVNSCMLGCPTMVTENRNCLGINGAERLASGASQVGVPESSPSLKPSLSEEPTKSPMKLNICDQSAVSSEDSTPESCKDLHVEAMNCMDDTDRSALSLGNSTAETLTEAQSPQHLLHDLEGRMGGLKTNEDFLDQLPPSNDQGNENSFGLSSTGSEKQENPYKELDCLEHTGMSPRHSGTEVTNEVSYDDGTKSLLCSAEGNDGHEDIQSFKPQLDENGQVNDMPKIVEEVEHKSSVKDLNASMSPKLLKDRISAILVQHHLSPSPAVYVDPSGEKDVSCVPSSPSPTNKVGSPVEAVICSVSSDSSKVSQNNGCCSADLHKEKNVWTPDNEGKFESGMVQKPKIMGNCANHVDARSMLKSFEATLGTLTRTKENIGRATRIAIDCAKCGVAAEVVEILARNLETESRLHRRVDLFFLVDSIAQCSRGLRGDGGGMYPSTIQAALPRLLSAAAPPGSTAQENRRQCLKVLRLWLDRRILPEAIIRCHMRKLDSSNGSSSIGTASRRSLRTERALNDPVREMEGMFDEYGSNSSFQLPGFCMPRMLKDEDEESDSDEGGFEAVTPEHNSETAEERGTNPVSAIEKHRHILEDVDGELEMEDVAPSSEEMNSTSNVSGVYTCQDSNRQCEQQFSLQVGPPLPKDVPPSSPPLPTSPPPLAPPPPPSIPPPSLVPPRLAPSSSAVSHTFTNDIDSGHYMGAHAVQDSFRHSVAQRSAAIRIDPTMSDAVRYNAPEHRDLQMRRSEPTHSCSSSSYPISHSPKRPLNTDQQIDSNAFHRKGYHVRPPHAAPSNQFSYVQEQMPARRDARPPFFSTRRNFPQNTGHGTYYSDEGRQRSAAYERSERYRFSSSSFHGRRGFDKDRVLYGPDPFIGPPRESARIPNQGWAFSSRGINHRNFIPAHPPENAFRTGNRAPSFWGPR